jgi:DNA topoisomerase IA
MDTTKKGKIFVCEKPSQAKYVCEALATVDDIVIISPAVRSHSFIYPKKIKFNEIPAIDLKPKYKDNLPLYGNYGYVFKKNINGKVNKVEQLELMNFYRLKTEQYSEYVLNNKSEIIKKTKQYILSFEEIVCAMDNDLTGVRGFKFYMEKYLDFKNYDFIDKHYKTKTTMLVFSACDKASLIKAFNIRESIKESSIFSALENSYIKKDFLEYNFNVNSMVLLGEILRKNGFFIDLILTKNLLITLLFIEKEITIPEHKLVDKMEELNVGNPASYSEIISVLYDNDLIHYLVKKVNGRDMKLLILPEDTKNILNDIHPKIKDFKISFNVINDVNNSSLSFKDFKDKYTKKLKTMFSKQKNYSRKNQ